VLPRHIRVDRADTLYTEIVPDRMKQAVESLLHGSDYFVNLVLLYCADR